MDVVQRDEQILVLRPGGVWKQLLITLLLVVGFLALLWSCGRVEHLTCDRMADGQVICQLRRTVFGLDLERKTITNLREARLDVHEGSKSDSYYVRLVLGAERIVEPFNQDSSNNYTTYKQVTDDINTFLHSSTLPRLDISLGAAVWMWLATAGVAFLTVLVANTLVEFLTTRWTFDRLQGLAIHHRIMLLGVRSNEYPLRTIKGVHITESRSTRGGTTYGVELVTHSAGTLSLKSWYNEDSSSYTATLIHEFLGIPVE